MTKKQKGLYKEDLTSFSSESQYFPNLEIKNHFTTGLPMGGFTVMHGFETKINGLKTRSDKRNCQNCRTCKLSKSIHKPRKLRSGTNGKLAKQGNVFVLI